MEKLDTQAKNRMRAAWGWTEPIRFLLPDFGLESR